jgi:23S rRNA pseudouridine1911/1915/1917 synthase
MVAFSRIVNPKHKVRLDKYLCSAGLGISRSQIQKLIEANKVLVNSQSVKSHASLARGDKVEVNYEKPEKFKIVPESIELDIVYEDEDVIVVNKAAGMVTHPAPGHSQGTLVNALLHHCDLGGDVSRETTRPGVLHRLDKDTSGLLVLAKSDQALVKLARQVEAHTMGRRYVAFVWGRMGMQEGTIDAPIGRHTLERKRMAVTPLRSRDAITCFKVAREFEYLTQLDVELKTGRTHQIRVHLAHLSHSVVGDADYGGRRKLPEVPGEVFDKLMRIMRRQALHARELSFVHPITTEQMAFSSSLPADMQELLDYVDAV